MSQTFHVENTQRRATMYPAGMQPSSWAPGDAVLIYDHKPTITHEAIQARERITCGHTPWANLTHSVCITSAKGDMIEANAPGIQRGNMDKYKGMDYWVVHPYDATEDQRAMAVQRWERQVGDSYDVVAWLGEFLYACGLPAVLGAKMWICSGLWCFGALAWEVSFPVPFQLMTPADIAKYYNLPIKEPWQPPNFFGRVLDRIGMVGRFFSHLF